MNPPINAELVDVLLAQPTAQAQSALLYEADLLCPDGLGELLGFAGAMMGSDPGKARRLAVVCELLAAEACAAGLIPGAKYLRAQTHAIDADFEMALSLIESARTGYAEHNNHYGAARTNVGRMFVLQELGRYDEALQVGESVQTYLKQTNALDAAQSADENEALAARVSQNLGLCYEVTGKYDQALTAYLDAEARFGRLDMTENLADVSNNRGIVLLSLGRGYDALKAFEKAQAIFDDAQLTLKQVQTLGNVGNAHLLVGNYARALAAFEQVRQRLESLAAESQRQILLSDLAEAYLSLNLYDEAVAMYREAGALLDSSGMQHDRARSLWGMGAALMALGQFDEAELALKDAATLFAAANNTPMRALVLLRRAALEATRGRHATGLAMAREALAAVEGGAWPLQQAHAHLSIADLVLPDVAQAEYHLQMCHSLASQLDLPGLRYLLNQRQGRLKLVSGNDSAAEPLLLAAAHEVEQLRSSVTEDRMRVSLATDKVAAYDDLVRLYASRNTSDAARQAFEMAERAKARALVVLLNKTATQPEARLMRQAAQLRTTQAELNATYTELMGGTDAALGKRSSVRIAGPDH